MWVVRNIFSLCANISNYGDRMSDLTHGNVFYPLPPNIGFDNQSTIGKIRKFRFDYENP